MNKIKSGVVYELALQGGQKDTAGNVINSDYAATMSGLVAGKDLASADWKGDMADDNRIGNPDNISFSEDLCTLFIGEDSGMHANNYVWAYNVDTKKLSRILSGPAGAEMTGLQAVDNLNGFRYIMSNIQHPGDEMILPDALKSQVEPQDRSVTITKGGKTLNVKIGDATATINGQEVKLQNPVHLENEKTVFPTATLLNFLN